MIDILEAEIGDSSLWELIVRHDNANRRGEALGAHFAERSQRLDTICYMIETEFITRSIGRRWTDWAERSIWELICWYEQFLAFSAAARLDREVARLSKDTERFNKAGKMANTFDAICNMIIIELEKR